MKNKTFLLAIALTIATLIGGCSNFTSNQTSDETKTDSILTINSKDDLTKFAEQCNSGNTFEGKVVNLESDICLTSDGTQTGETISWIGIGIAKQKFDVATNTMSFDDAKGFGGTFEGNDHTIFCNIENPEQANPFGLFSSIRGTGKINNLIIKGTFNGGFDIGDNKGEITNCQFTDSGRLFICNEGIIKDCIFKGSPVNRIKK